MATFKCQGETFVIRSRLSVVLSGEVCTGEITAGMTIWLSETDREAESHVIHAIEHVQSSRPVRSVGLVLKLSNESELTRVSKLPVAGRVLRVD